jgi:di/tricarboxylate transporter
MGEETPKYTVDEALVAMGFGNFQILVLVNAGMGWISEAMEMMLLSFVGPAVLSRDGNGADRDRIMGDPNPPRLINM